MKKSDLIISVIMICTGIGAMIKAADYPAQSRMIPYVYSTALIIFSLLLGLKTLMKPGKKTEEDTTAKDEPILRVLLIGAMIFGYIMSIQVLGFYTSTALFLIIFMGVMRAASLFVSLAVSAGTSVAVYFFFETLLNIPVPEGLFL
ncbi:tripartite tricarboxylate transporter TctB family protein [Aminivibrio sp.]|uniref:tripartite tricarboxylate transporter TctB family protein n=1 Tax=Aminivibrio sp. TaxID=1872489 RepID=UPI00345E5870